MENENISQPISAPLQPQTPNVPTNQPKPRNNKVIVIALFIVLLLIFIGIAIGTYSIEKNSNELIAPSPTPADMTGSALLSPGEPKTTDVTTGWKTYSSADYLFKYPSDWTNAGGNQGISFSHVINPHTAPLKDQIGLNVIPYVDKGNLTAEQFLSDVYYQGSKDQLTQMWIEQDTMEPITIGEIKATKFNHLMGGVGDFGEAVWVTSGNNGYFISLFPTSASNSAEIYKTVLSTFRFIN